MELKHQVCNLDLSKRLKAVGYPHTSLFDWCEIDDGEWMLMMRREKEHKEIMEQYPEHEGCISAPTASELGDVLPNEVSFDWGTARLRIEKYEDEWFVRYWMDHYHGEHYRQEYQTAPTLVDAMGEMVAYLADHGLITFNSK